MTVGAIKRHKRKKGFITPLLAFQKFNCFVGEEIHRVTFKTIALFLIDNVIPVEACCMSVRESYPVIESQLGFKRDTKMKFADQGCGVSGTLEQGWEVCIFSNCRPVFWPLGHQ